MYKPVGYSNTIFKTRYALHEEETWEEACKRLAKQMAMAESPENIIKYQDKFFEILVNNYFVAGGRIFYNSGRPNPQLLNCFVLRDELDSKQGWGGLSSDMIVTSMTGGGCGIDFTDVRPKGAIIHGQKGECPGPVSLMKLINGNGEPVRAGGARRVALMFSLSIRHPDIEEFLAAKLKNGELQLANVSVRCEDTTEFMKAVEKDLDWELSWKGQYKKTIKARDLWEKITQNAYDSAEPGFLNWELVEDENNVYYETKLTTTNPCFTGETLIKTVSGFQPIGSLVDQEIKLYNVNNELVNGSVWSNGYKKVVKIKLSSKETIRCTSDHKFMLNDNKECMAKDLKGKRLMPSFSINTNDTEFTKLGFIQGDGNLCRLNSKDHKGLELNIGDKDQDIADLFGVKTEDGKRTYYVNGYNEICEDLGFNSSPLPTRSFPSTYNSWSLEQKRGFLRGLYSANGSIIKAGRVSFKGTCLTLIEQLKDTLINDFGIDSYVTTNKPKEIKFKNGSYICKQSYDLNIGQFQNIVKFAKEIAFVHLYKNEDLETVIKEKSPLVMSVKDDGEEEVFDFNLKDDTHWGVVSQKKDHCGYIAHNCGEIALSPNDCCCLGHLVLPRFVKNGDVDWHLLAQTAKTGVRFLDNVLTVNHYPLPEMKTTSHKLRRIGLGTTGLADMIAMLGMSYGSQECLKFINKLYRFISKAAYEGSVMLAIEKGAFPACKPSEHTKSGFMKRMPKKIKAMVEEHGIRNCAILTQAPTGTVSILSGNCSSGIEPMFAPAYERRYWDKEERKTEVVFHPLFKQYMDEGKDVSHFVGSRELCARDHMEVQKVVQKHVDNAVSKTINLPENYPLEEMSKLWLEYLPHLKGTTFYRENTRGYVDENGKVHEPPLVALDLEEAKKRHTKGAKEGGEIDCSSGLCEI